MYGMSDKDTTLEQVSNACLDFIERFGYNVRDPLVLHTQTGKKTSKYKDRVLQMSKTII